jgi:hypothetical protein
MAAAVETEAAEAAGSNENLQSSDKRERSKRPLPFFFEFTCPLLGMDKPESSHNGTIGFQQKAPAGVTEKGLRFIQFFRLRGPDFSLPAGL